MASCSISSFLSEEEPDAPKNTVLPWDNFQNWVHCICVVTFDLELGQAMELCYPGHIKLSEQEKSNICYLSFPDSNSGCMGDTQFHFRIRRQASSHTYNGMSLQYYDKNCATSLQVDKGMYYGFVYFRQTKDKSLRRGYFQKSLVLLSKLPFVAFYNHLTSIIAPEFFLNGLPCLEAACHVMDQWPPPVPGVTLNLPLMGTVMQIRIPDRHDKLLDGATASKISTGTQLRANTILPTVHEVDIFRSLNPVFMHTQLLWELVLTNEPLVVIAASPTQCSAAVHSLVSMIAPMKYCSDYRPYFTIHDSEFREYTTRTQAPPEVILGVTNPFFAKTLQGWPHIVRLGDSIDAKLSKAATKTKKGSNLKTLDSKPGLYTRYKPFIDKDKDILKNLIKGTESGRPIEVQNVMVKRFLLELTQTFIIPLERYVFSQLPLQRNINPFHSPPTLPDFDEQDFLQTIDQSGPQLTTRLKGDWVGLYRKFFASKNFEGWWQHRRFEVNQKLKILHIEALSNSELSSWMSNRAEVEVVDLFLTIKEKLMYIKQHQLPIKEDVVTRLREKMQVIIDSLPLDLQSVLHKQ